MANQIIPQDDDLELTSDDLYANGYFVQFDDGTQILQREIEPYTLSPGDEYVTGVVGEDITQLSYDAYTNSKLWHKIADVNNIFNPFDSIAGKGLIIPKLDNTNGLQ